jgi:hypothetical protein
MTAQISNFDIEEPDGEEMKAFADRIAKHRNPGCQAASYVFLVDAEWLDADGESYNDLVAARGGSVYACEGLAHAYLRTAREDED